MEIKRPEPGEEPEPANAGTQETPTEEPAATKTEATEEPAPRRRR